MKNLKNKKDVTVLDFTQKLNDKVNEIYENQELRNKALFILYLINRGTNNDVRGYQLNVTNHRDIFSYNGVEWAKLFNPLIENEIIECTTPHSKGKSSKFYKINNSYQWVRNKGEIKVEYRGEDFDSLPQYIQQFHLDKQVVKSSTDTKWSKNYYYVPKEIITEDEREAMTELKNKMFFMGEAIDLMRIEFEKQIEELKNQNIQLKTEIENLKNNTTVVAEQVQTIEEVPAPEVDYDNTPLFVDDEDDNFGFVFPNEQVQPKIVEAESNSYPIVVDEFTKYIENKLKSAKVQPIYWNNAIKYIKENKEASNPIELGKLISISTGSSQVIINKVKQYWN